MPAAHTIGIWTTFGCDARATGRRWRHVLVDVFGEGHELFFAQLAVAVLIELGKHFFGLRHFGRTIVVAIWAAAVVMTVWAVTISMMTISMMTISMMTVTIMAISIMSAAIFAVFFVPRSLTAFAIVTSLTMASLHELTHFLAGFLAFIVAEFAVAVFVKLFDDLFANFGAGCAVVAFLGIAAVGICSHDSHGQQTGSREDKTTYKIPHVFFTFPMCGLREGLIAAKFNSQHKTMRSA